LLVSALEMMPYGVEAGLEVRPFSDHVFVGRAGVAALGDGSC
jgi:hypothetical protein